MYFLYIDEKILKSELNGTLEDDKRAPEYNFGIFKLYKMHK